MSVRTDTVNLIVNVNGNQAQNNLNNLRKRAVDLTAEMKGLKKSTEEYKAKAAELKTVVPASIFKIFCFTFFSTIYLLK